MSKYIEKAATEYLEKIAWLDNGSAEPEDIKRAFKAGASYQSQNSVSKEHYDELKLNYDILVEENKRLNERELAESELANEMLLKFAIWMDSERNKIGDSFWKYMKIWGKENANQLMLQQFLSGKP